MLFCQEELLILYLYFHKIIHCILFFILVSIDFPFWFSRPRMDGKTIEKFIARGYNKLAIYKKSNIITVATNFPVPYKPRGILFPVLRNIRFR